MTEDANEQSLYIPNQITNPFGFRRHDELEMIVRWSWQSHEQKQGCKLSFKPTVRGNGALAMKFHESITSSSPTSLILLCHIQLLSFCVQALSSEAKSPFTKHLLGPSAVLAGSHNALQGRHDCFYFIVKETEKEMREFIQGHRAGIPILEPWGMDKKKTQPYAQETYNSAL